MCREQLQLVINVRLTKTEEWKHHFKPQGMLEDQRS